VIAILDASAAVEVILDRPQSQRIQKNLSSAGLVVSPDLFAAEITNVFRKLNKAGEVNREKCEVSIEKSLALVDDLGLAQK